MSSKPPRFKYLEEIFAYVAEGIRPPERITVSQAAERYRYLYNPGSYVGYWDNSVTPYLVEFMDEMTSEDYTGIIFCGPAQCGKTDTVLNFVTHTVVADPMDMMIVEKTFPARNDFVNMKLDRLLEHSKEVSRRLRPGRNSSSLGAKKFSSGMILTCTFPTKNNLSGKSVPLVWLSDYDRMPQDVDGEGSPYWLAKKRTTTFGRRAMCVAESSPSFPVDLVKWTKSSKHEAPPTQGILSLYNLGDRRRWYWKCVSCGEAFEPDFQNMKWPESEDIRESAEAAYMECPHCAARYYDEDGDLPGKHRMNREHARWIKDGQVWKKDGTVAGEPPATDIASFWLKGPAATFMTFKQIVGDYLKALRSYEQTGNEEDLQTVTNTTLALPYVPRADRIARTPEELKSRAQPLPERQVPPGVRFLIATIDLQKNRFVVQVHGIGSGESGDADWWIIDRFDIKKSRRRDEDGERYWVNPGVYPEDWRQLTDEVILKTYPLADDSGRRMAIRLVTSDIHGREGFTMNAYAFWRWLRGGDTDPIRDENGKTVYVWEPGLDAKFWLLRGSSNPRGPRVRLTYPDSQRKDKYVGARGEIPVYEVNTQVLKDAIDARLDRLDRGGMIHFPDWLDGNFFKELTVEIKDPVKGWINPKNYRNESWDLLVYCQAALLYPQINFENIDWSDPPGWAREWDENDLVYDPGLSDRPFAGKDEDTKPSLEELGGLLA